MLTTVRCRAATALPGHQKSRFRAETVRETSRTPRFRAECEISGGLLRQLLQRVAHDPAEGREGVDEVGQDVERRPRLDGEGELGEVLARPRLEDGRADQHARLPVAHQLEEALLE